MSADNAPGVDILSRGSLVMLRGLVKTDREHYQKWQKGGEWRAYDAPWARNKPEEKQHQEEKTTQGDQKVDPSPKKMAVIATLDNKPLGWVNRYSPRANPLIWYVGIDICEDDFLDRGYGTEALRLWVDYLFENSDYHKICLDTWSFNPRMARVAEKIGFTAEGCQRELQFWQGEWLDLLHYGMLREEWEADKKR